MPKLIAETVDQTENVWKIYDNFTLENIYDGKSIIHNYDRKFMSHLRRLEPRKRYFFDNWSSEYFNSCFRIASDTTQFDVVIDVYGFDPIKCKECGFEIETSVCPNCGEWN